MGSNLALIYCNCNCRQRGAELATTLGDTQHSTALRSQRQLTDSFRASACCGMFSTWSVTSATWAAHTPVYEWHELHPHPCTVLQTQAALRRETAPARRLPAPSFRSPTTRPPKARSARQPTRSPTALSLWRSARQAACARDGMRTEMASEMAAHSYYYSIRMLGRAVTSSVPNAGPGREGLLCPCLWDSTRGGQHTESDPIHSGMANII